MLKCVVFSCTFNWKKTMDTRYVLPLIKWDHSWFSRVTGQHQQGIRYFSQDLDDPIENDDLNFSPSNEVKKQGPKKICNNHLLKMSHNAAVITINILKQTPKKALRFVKKHPELNKLPVEEIEKRLHYLIDKNVTPVRIFAMPWLLLRKSEVLESEVQQVSSDLALDYQLSLPYVILSPPSLRMVKDLWISDRIKHPEVFENPMYKNRLDYIAHVLGCSPVTVADFVAKVRKVSTTSFKKIQTTLKILLENDVKTEDIISDPHIFLQHIYRTEKERALLVGHPTLSSFIKTRLCCTTTEVEKILFKVPAIKTASAMKLDDMIEYLYSQGYTSQDILRVPRVLGHSKDTIAARIEEFNVPNLPSYSISVFCGTSKKWALFIKKLPSNYRQKFKKS